MLGIRRTKCTNRREQLVVFVVALVTLAQSLIEIGSFGTLSCEWPAYILFSPKVDDFIGR